MCSPYLAFTALTGNQTKEPIHQQPRNGSGWSLGTAERKYWFNQSDGTGVDQRHAPSARNDYKPIESF